MVSISWWKLLTDHNWRAVENLHCTNHTVGEIIWRFSTFSSVGICKQAVTRVCICVYGFTFPGFPWYSGSSAVLCLSFLEDGSLLHLKCKLKIAYVRWWLNWIALCRRVKLKSVDLTVELQKKWSSRTADCSKLIFFICVFLFFYVVLLSAVRSARLKSFLLGVRKRGLGRKSGLSCGFRVLKLCLPTFSCQ